MIALNIDKTVCPFCWGRVETSRDKEDNAIYTCSECNRVFNDDDFKHELLRQRISSVCSAFMADENNPLSCILEDAMELHIEGVDEAAQGLREAEKPLVSNIFEDSTNVVWATIDGEIIEIDRLLTESLEEILEWLEENYDVQTYGRMNKKGVLIDI